MAFSADGNIVAAGGAVWIVDGGAVGFVQMWNSVDGTAAGPSMKVGLGVMDVAFTPADGRGLVVASFDPYEVQVWDTGSPEEARFTFPGHESQVVSVAVSLDGSRIVSASADGNVRVWPNLPAGAASDALCAKLTSSISESQWKAWISKDLPWQPTCPDLDTTLTAKPK